MSTRSFANMLNEYLPNRLLKEELIKRNWIIANVNRDDSWAGGQVIVPFMGAQASSVSWSTLTAANDIAEDQYVRGVISDYKELWGTMKFNHRDLVDHEGKIPEATFLKLLPDTVEQFMDYASQVASIAMTSGEVFARATANGAVGGTIAVDKIDRFVIGQRLQLIDNDTSTGDFYVIGVNVNTNIVTLSATRGGGAADLSAYTLAQQARFLHPNGAAANSFTSIRSALLSAANGGSTAIHGVTKTAWPYLQAVNVSGASATTSNFLDLIFSAYSTVQQKARGRAATILMSLRNLGVVLQLIQIEKGPFHVSPTSKKAMEYNWQEIVVGSPNGQELKIVGIQEMDDDVVYFMDMKAMTFRSKGFFKKRKAPDGREYFEVRNTSGYEYLVDICLFGELEVTRPGNCGVLFGIPAL